MHDSLSIPPDLDRALAMTVLETMRPRPDGADGPPVIPSRLDELLGDVVRALPAAGASPEEVLDAVQDAFAALLAARQGDPGRETVRTLDAHARATTRRLLALPPTPLPA